MIRNAPVADHPSHDVQGRAQQALQLGDAGLEVVVETRQVMLDGLQTILDETRRPMRVGGSGKGIVRAQMRGNLALALDPPELVRARELPDIFVAFVDAAARIVQCVLRLPEIRNGSTDEPGDLLFAWKTHPFRRRGTITQNAAEGTDPVPAILRQTLVPFSLAARASCGAGLSGRETFLLCNRPLRLRRNVQHLLRIDSAQIDKPLWVDLSSSLLLLPVVLLAGALRITASVGGIGPCRLEGCLGAICSLAKSVTRGLGLDFDAVEIAELP